MNIKKRILLLVCLFLTLTGYSQSRTGISGTIVDAETKDPIIGVQVYFIATSNKASTIGTTTDFDGKFSLSTTERYITVKCQMIGYKPELITLRAGQIKKGVTIEMKPDVIGLQDIVVTPKKEKNKYKRKGNPAVELIKEVIAHKDSATAKCEPLYIADTYTRASFALDNFTPNFNKGLWKDFAFVQDYIDTTGEYPALTISIRENVAKEYYQQHPKREKKILGRKRIFGVEDLLTTSVLQKNINAIFQDVDINNDNIEILFNRFVSPISKSLAVSYYQYYIMDTILIDGDSCIDLAFVPINSESYSFTGHLYIVNDSTYKIKKYDLNVPKNININFVSDFSVEHTYNKDSLGHWIPERTNTFAKFYLTKRDKTLLLRQTKLYTHFDFESDINPKVFSSLTPTDTLGPLDTISIREDLALWERMRPEPLTFYESSVMDLLQQFKETPKFNALIMTIDALTSEYVATVPSTRWGESKWDFGPIYSTISYNMLEGARIRIGGQTTANLHPNLFFMGYVAFGSTDLRPKYNATLLYSFIKKKYQPFYPLRHYISLSAQYDVEEPGEMQGIVERDNILMSIPTSTPTMKYYQYAFHAKAFYMKEWVNHLTLKTYFDFEHNSAAGAMSYNRICSNIITDSVTSIATQNVGSYNCYEWGIELRYSPGADFPINRQGVESPFTLEQDAPVISLNHKMGYLDDRYTGGIGFYYNKTELTAEKRFWFSSFGHLDTRLQGGIVWNKVPFTKLCFPSTSTSIFLGKNAFNLMQPMEFIMDKYVALYMTYFFKGWILNRIPGINRLKLRGVVSFSGIYGGLSNHNNPFSAGNTDIYQFPCAVKCEEQGDEKIYTSGYISSPLQKLPYMELTVGLENILKFVRIDYVRRLTYNDYNIPMLDGTTIHRKLGGWGRNGVKVTVRFEF